MVSIFFEYLLDIVDFVYKMAVIAFVAKSFDLITVKAKTEEQSQVHTTADKTTRGVKKDADPLGGLMERMGPMMNQLLGSLKDKSASVPPYPSEEENDVQQEGAPVEPARKKRMEIEVEGPKETISFE